jgi:fumarate hydratase class II
MVAAQVIGHDTAITHGGLGSHFELNTMMPLLAHNLLRSIEWLSAGVKAFTERCVVGIEADETHIQSTLEHSLALATGLTSVIQYDQAAEISKEAYRDGKTVRQVTEERGFLSSDELESALDPFRMTEPGRIS